MARQKKNTRKRASMESLSSELTDHECTALCSSIRLLPRPCQILEVGTAAGGTLVEILKIMEYGQHAKREHVCVIDTFQYFEDHRRIWEDHLTRNGFDPQSVTVYAGKSSQMYRDTTLQSRRFSFILVDAGHKLKDVIRDVRLLSLLEVDGVGAFHDYSDRFPGVMLAVDTFLKRNPEFEREALEGTLMFVRKKRETTCEVMPGWIIGWMTFRSLLMQWEKSLRKRLPRAGRQN